MAEKRMFSNKVIGSDAFLEMPDSTQNLYFHLSMYADDDGFVDKPKSIIRMTGKKEDDLKLLIAKSFIIPFETGVIVIKHWRVNNYLRNDRYKPTQYLEEKAQLNVNEIGEYNLGIPVVDKVDTQYRIDKNRIDKNNIICEQVAEEKPKFKKPTLEEVNDYCKERNNGIDAEAFIAFYESKGWLIGKAPMKNWKSAIITWEKSRNQSQIQQPYATHKYSKEQLSQMFDNLDEVEF